MTQVNDIDANLQYAFYDELIFKAFPEYINLSFEEIHRTVGNVTAGFLLEKAIARTGNLTRYNSKGMDFTDGSDAKSSSVRTCANGRIYSAPITGLKNKQGLLRAMVYERKMKKFYYFLIPYSAYEYISDKSNIEIYFNHNGMPRRNTVTRTCENIWAYEVADFNGILCSTAPTKWSYIRSLDAPSTVKQEPELIGDELDQCLFA